MRLHFPNTSRLKKAAKHLAARLAVPLSSAQRAVARACGYRDWHDLEGGIHAGPACALDHILSPEMFIERQARLVLAVAHDLSVADGDVQYALAEARLTGDRPTQLREQIAIRLTCWRTTSLPVTGPRQRGALGTLKTAGRNGEVVILREYGSPTETISHQGVTGVADFEYVSPRVAPTLFLPMRLYLPYGYWTEADGARVVFSRDYKPMWRLRAGKPVERVDPWLWIRFTKETHLWENAQTPWRSPQLAAFLENYLIENGLQMLPVMADALPLLVHDRSKHSLNMANGADLLRSDRVQPLEAA